MGEHFRAIALHSLTGWEVFGFHSVCAMTLYTAMFLEICLDILSLNFTFNEERAAEELGLD